MTQLLSRPRHLATVVAISILLVAVTLTWTSSETPVSAAPPLSLSCNTALVPVPDLGQVIPIDLGTRESGDPIDLPGAYMITVSPDASTAWVVSNNATAPFWTLSPIDLATGDVGASLPLDAFPQAGPVSRPVVTPDGDHILIGTTDFLMVIDVATSTIEPLIGYPTGFFGTQVAITPDGATVLVGSDSEPYVLTIEFAPRLLGQMIPVSNSAGVVAITPDGRSAYGAAGWEGFVVPIDLATMTAGATLPSLSGAFQIAIDPDGTFAVVDNGYTMATLDLASGSLSPSIAVDASLGLTLTPDGATALALSHAPDELTPVDLATRTPGTPIPLPGTALHVAAIAPGQAPVAELAAEPAASGEPTRFDASASTASCGAVESYTWDFGDGSELMTFSTPVVEHTYAAAGRYTATLTVIDSTGTSTEQVFTGMSMSRNGGPQAVTSLEVQVAQGAAQPVETTASFTG